MNPTPQTSEDAAHAAAIQRHTARQKRRPVQPRVVSYYHATPAQNVASIMQHGLLVAYSQGKVKAIWLCTRAVLAWAVRHVQRRHGTDDVAVLTVRVRRRDCIRFGHGRWFVTSDIGPEDITV